MCVCIYIYIHTHTHTHTHVHTKMHTCMHTDTHTHTQHTHLEILFGPSSLIVVYLVIKCTVVVKKWTPKFTDSNVHVCYINCCNSYPYSLATSCAVFALPTMSFVYFFTFHKYFISTAYDIITRSTVHVGVYIYIATNVKNR